MHSNNVCHRDIKPENILLDQDFQIKIVDFGFSVAVSGRDGSGLLQSYLGTPLYMAPEIHSSKKYEGKSVDLFATAILLFILVSAHPPFKAANLYDPLYKQIANKNYTVFWNYHSQHKPMGFYSEEFKSLFNKMVAYDPKERLSSTEILAHPWLQGPCPSLEELQAEFGARKSLINMHNHAEETKIQHTVATTGYRSLDAKQAEKTLCRYKEGLNELISFKTKCNASVMMNALTAAIDGLKCYNISYIGKKYKVVVKPIDKIEKLAVQIKLCSVSEGVLFVDIMKIEVR